MTTGAMTPQAHVPDSIVQRSGRGHAAWQIGASVLVQSLWNPLLLIAMTGLIDDRPLDLASPIGFSSLLLVVVLFAIAVTLVYALVRSDDIKLDATGWSTGRRGKWRQLRLSPTTAIEPVWSPAHGWRVRVRSAGVKRLYLHAPWVPPWRRRGAAFDNELRTIRGVAERYGAQLQPVRRRLAWWPIIGSLLIVGGFAGVGYAGARDGVVWPWSATIDQTLDACQALDSAKLGTHWPERERKREDTGLASDDQFDSVRDCAWVARDESALRRITLTVDRNKSTLAGSGTVSAVADARFDFESWTKFGKTYGEARAVDGLGDEGYLVHDPDGRETELSFHVANVGVELTVDASEDGQPTESLALALGNSVADQLRAMRS